MRNMLYVICSFVSRNLDGISQRGKIDVFLRLGKITRRNQTSETKKSFIKIFVPASISTVLDQSERENLFFVSACKCGKRERDKLRDISSRPHISPLLFSLSFFFQSRILFFSLSWQRDLFCSRMPPLSGANRRKWYTSD